MQINSRIRFKLELRLCQTAAPSCCHPAVAVGSRRRRALQHTSPVRCQATGQSAPLDKDGMHAKDLALRRGLEDFWNTVADPDIQLVLVVKREGSQGSPFLGMANYNGQTTTFAATGHKDVAQKQGAEAAPDNEVNKYVRRKASRSDRLPIFYQDLNTRQWYSRPVKREQLAKTENIVAHLQAVCSYNQKTTFSVYAFDACPPPLECLPYPPDGVWTVMLANEHSTNNTEVLSDMVQYAAENAACWLVICES